MPPKGRRSTGSAGAAVPLLRLPRIAVIGELEEKYKALTRKAVSAASKASKEAEAGASANAGEALQAVFDAVRAAAFGALRSSAVEGDAAGEDGAVEELDRDLAREADRLRKAEEKLGKAVKEARDKNRTALPTQLKAAYASRLAALTADAEAEDEEMEEVPEAAGAGAGAGRGSASKARKPGGRKSLISLESPRVAVAAAGLKQQLKVLKETAEDVTERVAAVRRVVPRLAADVQDALTVAGRGAGKRTAIEAAIAAVPTPRKKAAL